MAVYFFHLRDGRDVLIDDEGRDVESEAIADWALREARCLISQAGAINFKQSVEVRDEAGELIHKLAFKEAVSISH